MRPQVALTCSMWLSAEKGSITAGVAVWFQVYCKLSSREGITTTTDLRNYLLFVCVTEGVCVCVLHTCATCICVQYIQQRI